MLVTSGEGETYAISLQSVERAVGDSHSRCALDKHERECRNVSEAITWQLRYRIKHHKTKCTCRKTAPKRSRAQSPALGTACGSMYVAAAAVYTIFSKLTPLTGSHCVPDRFTRTCFCVATTSALDGGAPCNEVKARVSLCECPCHH